MGSIKSDLSSYPIEQIEENYANTNIQLGGHWFPSICTARDRVAIIIPYHQNHKQLRIFLNFMHQFLQKQQLDYQIFLIESVRIRVISKYSSKVLHISRSVILPLVVVSYSILAIQKR